MSGLSKTAWGLVNAIFIGRGMPWKPESSVAKVGFCYSITEVVLSKCLGRAVCTR